jgi:hypothetical protein
MAVGLTSRNEAAQTVTLNRQCHMRISVMAIELARYLRLLGGVLFGITQTFFTKIAVTNNI